jgi:hypothetical protein
MKLGTMLDKRFNEVLNKLFTEPVPLRTAFKIKGIIKLVGDEAVKYEEVRKSALNRLGLKNEDGTLKVDDNGNAQFADDNLQEFVKELNDLTSLEVEVAKIKLSEFGDKISLSALDLVILDSLIEEV